jgi:hypothetical protein
MYMSDARTSMKEASALNDMQNVGQSLIPSREGQAGHRPADPLLSPRYYGLPNVSKGSFSNGLIPQSTHASSNQSLLRPGITSIKVKSVKASGGDRPRLERKSSGHGVVHFSVTPLANQGNHFFTDHVPAANHRNVSFTKDFVSNTEHSHFAQKSIHDLTLNPAGPDDPAKDENEKNGEHGMEGYILGMLPNPPRVIKHLMGQPPPSHRHINGLAKKRPHQSGREYSLNTEADVHVRSHHRLASKKSTSRQLLLGPSISPHPQEMSQQSLFVNGSKRHVAFKSMAAISKRRLDSGPLGRNQPSEEPRIANLISPTNGEALLPLTFVKKYTIRSSSKLDRDSIVPDDRGVQIDNFAGRPTDRTKQTPQSKPLSSITERTRKLLETHKSKEADWAAEKQQLQSKVATLENELKQLRHLLALQKSG